MITRREFLSTVAAGAAATTLQPSGARAQTSESVTAPGPVGGALPKNDPSGHEHYRPRYRFGLGGVAIGTGFEKLTARQSDRVMRAAWQAGTRYFDTSPFYGLGVSERRMGHFLHDKNREDYILSTKIGRVLEPADEAPDGMWKAPSPFKFDFDYSADGVHRSLDQSFHRLGLSQIDVVFIHDLGPSFFGKNWTEKFEEAADGAIPELTRMREEGTIRGWGFGVNSVEPCLKALEVGDPDLFLLATEYSIVEHEQALNELFPRCAERDVSIVVGAPLNSGYLAGKNRYNYSPGVPDRIKKRGDRIREIARQHGTDLRTAALQFCNAPEVVSAVIPGASSGQQVIENALSLAGQTPPAMWKELKREGLIAKNAPTPS